MTPTLLATRAFHRALRPVLHGVPPSFYPAHPLVLAHRGARTRAAENTLAAFRLGMEEGAHGVELDVLLTADRRVIVFHDETLARLGRPGDSVASLTAAELQALDVGDLVKDGPRVGPARMPLLDEVFEALPRDAIINVELKGDARTPDGLEVEVIRCVARARAEHRVVFSSFNPLRCARLRSLAPDMPVGMLHEEDQPRHLRELWWLPAVMPQALHPSRVLCDAAYAAHAAALGLPIHTWTVNDPAEVRRLAALGVHAIITDRPAMALQALRG